MATAQTKFITAYGPKTKVRTETIGLTRTHQSGKDECDINLIMARYVKTGTLDHQKQHGDNYGFATSIDLHEALSTIEQANSMFNDLPSSIRTKMQNDPGQFLDFVQNPDNEAELITMGLANPREDGEIAVQAPPAGEEKGAAPATPEAPKESE